MEAAGPIESRPGPREGTPAGRGARTGPTTGPGATRGHRSATESSVAFPQIPQLAVATKFRAAMADASKGTREADQHLVVGVGDGGRVAEPPRTRRPPARMSPSVKRNPIDELGVLAGRAHRDGHVHGILSGPGRTDRHRLLAREDVATLLDRRARPRIARSPAGTGAA